jgi:aldehyde dehydrogenase (NAD+)
VFTNDQKNATKVLSETSSGGACVNETTFHVLCPELPFGGGLYFFLYPNSYILICPQSPNFSPKFPSHVNFLLVGPSGMGAYHGKASFNLFTHRKSVLTKPLGSDPAIRYPPFTASKVKWLERLNSLNFNTPTIGDLWKVVVPVALLVGGYVYVV